MKIVVESKQVGPVSYMCPSLLVLETILTDMEILRSRKTERNPDNGKPQYYVSLSRNLTSAAMRNNDRWRFGVILDGDKLSSRYHISPISYTGVQTKYSDLRVKAMMAYDDGTYALTLVKWPTVPITKSIYESIKRAILEDMDDELKEKKKLIHTGAGKVRRNGKLLVEKFLFNVPSGGLRITQKTYPELCSKLAKSESMNETEERIWLADSRLFINISKCVTGIILPKQMTPEEEDTFERTIQPILESLHINNIVKY